MVAGARIAHADQPRPEPAAQGSERAATRAGTWVPIRVAVVGVDETDAEQDQRVLAIARRACWATASALRLRRMARAS